jgi:tRNA(fMet)-specific endonuclease VapC
VTLLILDTDTLTLLTHHNAKVEARFTANVQPITITIITYHEVMTGRAMALFNPSDQDQLRIAQENLRRSEIFLKRFECLWFEDAALNHFSRLREQKLARKIGLKDLLIASIALAHNATLVTRNTKDFAKVPNLKLENWAD